MNRKWTIEDDKGKVVDELAGPGEKYAQQAASISGKLHQPTSVVTCLSSVVSLQ